MIPIRDLNPTTRRAIVTLALLALNIGVYFLVQVRQEGTEIVRGIPIEAQDAFVFEYAAIPCEIIEREPVSIEELRTGDCRADEDSPELFPDKQIFLAVLFSMFLHGGLLHIAGNMLFLWIFGNNVEDRLGHVAYLVFYLAGGLAAAFAHVAVDPSSTIPVVGASGAIAAVMGAYLVWYPNAPIRTIIVFFFILFTEIRAWMLLTGWFVLQFFTSPDAGVAWVAHVGGFAFGVLVGLALRPKGQVGATRPAFSRQWDR
ncbi:MAG: rhomboid family intramembrane serine protease [Acidimicrobiales bacterium]